MTGLTDLYVISGNSTAQFTGVNSSPNVHLTSASNNVTVTNAATVGLGDADAVTIALNGASATASSTLTYNDIETFNVVTSGAATGTATRSQSLVSDQLETVNVSGSAAANITVLLDGADDVGAVGTVDASEMTGALRATVTAGTSGILSVTGGSGNDTLTVNNGAMNDDLTIDGGDGVDTLVVTAAAYAAAAATQAGAGVTNMEVLAVAGGSADVRAFSNNTFASFVSVGAASITGLGTDAVSLTATAGGNQTLDRATDGAADVATVSLASTAGQTVGTLNVADEETVTINSVSTLAGSNVITTLTGTDLTSLTIAGTRDLTITNAITGTKLATLDASGLSGTGTVLSVSASNSTADMTVTGAAGVESTDGEVMNTITTGSGDDSITTGDYADTINAGNGDNTVVAGDGDNNITTGRGDDTITAGDGDNTIDAGIGDDTITVGDGDNGITAGNGDDTVTAGGTTTSTTVFDTNTVNLGSGDDTYTGGAGRDIVTMGTGDDTVDTGAGTDSIINADYDDDDVINGGAGTDTLSALALATGAAAAAAQIQAEDRFVEATPGVTRTSTPQITGVESVYLQVNVGAANTEATATTNETVDFSSTSGITNLYLEIDDQDAAGANLSGKLTLSDVDAAAIHLVDRATDDNLGELVIAGTGQASLTLKGFDFDGGTDLTVSDVDAVTLTSYQSSSVLSVGVTSYGDVEADDADTVTATMTGTTAALAGSSLTINSLSADGATAINLNAGSFNTLAITGDVTSTSESLDTMAIVVSDDGTLTANEIRTTGSEMTSATITLGVASTLTITGEIDLESVEDVTITVGAASTLTANDLVMGGDVVINATMGSNIGVDTFGAAGITGTFDINGRGDLGAQTLVNGVAATKTLAMEGTTTLNIAGYTDTTGGTITIDAATATKATFVGNNQATSITTGAGADSITTGSGGDTVVDAGAGNDVINTGAGNDTVTDAGTGDDVITLGAGNDTVTTAGAGDDTITAGEGTDDITGGAGSDAINLTETTSVTDIVRGFVTANQSTVASADTWTAAGNVAGETITFATGTAGSVDTIAGFVSGVDDLDVTNANTLPTTLIGIAEAAALVDGTVYVAYGTYNATTGVFTTAAAYDATTAHDALLVEGDGAQTIVNEQDYVILTGLNQALVAADFI